MNMKRKSTIGTWALLAALGLALAGCGDSNVFEDSGDDDSAQARKEAGIEALNDGDWAEAQRIFLSLDPTHADPELSGYLASAYAGEAGFDALELVQNIFDAQDQDVGASVIYASVTAMFDADGDGKISAGELQAKMALVQEAMAVLEAPGSTGRVAPAASAPDPWGDALFQRGLYAAVHAVLGIVSQLKVDPNAADGDLYLTLAELDAHRGAIDAVTVTAGDFDLNEDLGCVDDANAWLRSSYPNGNKIADEIEKFLDDLGYTTDGSDEDTLGDVDDGELRAYLNWLLDLLPDA